MKKIIINTLLSIVALLAFLYVTYLFKNTACDRVYVLFNKRGPLQYFTLWSTIYIIIYFMQHIKTKRLAQRHLRLLLVPSSFGVLALLTGSVSFYRGMSQIINDSQAGAAFKTYIVYAFIAFADIFIVTVVCLVILYVIWRMIYIKKST